MERRTVTDLQRNNLVAGFLRKLEYYQGILFLTTNRVGTFDEAFLSRIDIPIYYRDFTPAQRVQIWETFFRKLETDREDTMRVSRRTRDYVKEDPLLLGLEWNARQIRSGKCGVQRACACAAILINTPQHSKLQWSWPKWKEKESENLQPKKRL